MQSEAEYTIFRLIMVENYRTTTQELVENRENQHSEHCYYLLYTSKDKLKTHK